MPIWLLWCTYKYKKVYQVVVNGYAGHPAGDYPKSPWKIALLVVMVIIVVAIVLMFGEQ